MKIVEGGVCAAKGFLSSGVHCGIRKNKEKRDITRAEFAEYLFRNKVKDGSFTDSKKWIEASGIFKGDINGDMMYDKPFTRAECCTVLRRLENEEK